MHASDANIDITPFTGVNSLKYTIVIPVVALVLTSALVAGLLVFRYVEAQLLYDAKNRAEIIAYSVQYTAEIAGVSPELNRSVQALGTESDVSLINVIHLQSGKLLASNRFGWRNKTIHDIDLSQFHHVILQNFEQLNKENSHDIYDGDFFALQDSNQIFTYASPFLIESVSGQSRLQRALVIVDLNVSVAAHENRRQMIILATLLLFAVVGVIALIYLLLAWYIFRPISNIESAISKRAQGNTTAQAAILRDDEIGMLAKTLNDLIRFEEQSKGILLERERELKLIFENVPVKIWYKDDKNNILRLNHYAAESMGMSVSDIEGKNTAELFPEMADKYLQDDLEVIHSGEPKLNIIERYTPVHGEAGWVKTDKVPYVSAGGQARGVLVVSQDITALKQAEDKLRESETRFQLVIDATRDGIWDWPNMAEDYEYWSPQWKALLGYKEDEIEASASQFFSMLHGDDVELVENALKAHLEEGKPFDVEYRLQTKSGDFRWFQARGVVTASIESNIQRMTGSITDIQYRKETEIKLKEYNAELERSNRDLDEFAYIASHDLKSPLRGIDQISGWIAEDIEEGRFEETQENLSMLRGRVKRMERLLTDLLTYSRVGRRDEVLKSIDVKELAYDLFSLNSPPDKFSLALKGELPTFITLAAPFEQVLRNLISNAIKHHHREDGKITISCKDEEGSDMYDFSVTDDGPGIEKRYHDLVFKMFKSLKPRDEVEGSGIGLALIKKIIHTYGGGIQLESKPGEGTTFCFTWPKQIDKS